LLNRTSGVATDVTTPSYARPDGGVKDSLDTRPAASAGSDVFQEPQLPAGPKHPLELPQCRALIADRTQHERYDDRVDTARLNRKSFSETVNDLNLYGRVSGGCVGKAP
jgi:hypothetical protein